MPKTRNKFVVATLAMLALATMGVYSTSTSAQSKSITFSLSDQMRVTYFWLYVPEILGYWNQESLKVNIEPVGGSLEALQQVAAEHAQFGQMGTNAVIQANVKEHIPAQVVLLNGVFQWAMAVPENSPITKPQDLKGKSIGVYSLSTNGNAFLKAYLKAEGLDPETDVDLVAVGFGGPALHALETGSVAALYFWDSAFISYENQGSHFRYFRSPDWVKYPDYAVAALKKAIDTDPLMVESFVRGMVKGIVFTEANPACAVKLFWKNHPDAKPTDVSDEVALDHELKFLKAQMLEGELAYKATGGTNWGAITPTNIADLQAFMTKAGELQGESNPASMIVEIPDFFTKVNKFDKNAVEADAKKCAY
jgi:NitT/TauT family transport system substrate-binding protein